MLARWLGDLLSPPACAACDEGVRAGVVFCPACAASVVRAGPGEPIAFGAFGGALAVAIRRLKYSERPDLARPLGELLREACRAVGPEVDLVVPVPLHPRRLADRGYNQAALLAAPVARELGATFEARGLVRSVDTPRQAEQGREARLANVSDAFRARAPARVAGRAILVVDDVATTGATLDACASALLLAGARRVSALVLARTLAG